MELTAVSPKTLDAILTYQFTVAWAGEALSDPPRLKWWRTDLVDEYGGGDLMLRLAPRTHKWAALEAVRRAAALTDRKARSRMANPDSVRTLYFWGFELDERLTERIRDLKWSLKPPAEVLSFPVPLTADFDKGKLEAALKALAPDVACTVQMSGRELKGRMPDDYAEAGRMLTAALVPFSDEYSAPFFRV